MLVFGFQTVELSVNAIEAVKHLAAKGRDSPIQPLIYDALDVGNHDLTMEANKRRVELVGHVDSLRIQ